MGNLRNKGIEYPSSIFGGGGISLIYNKLQIVLNFNL